MTGITLEDSLSGGGSHHLLGRLVGDWEGTTRVWFEPGVLADESPARGSARSVLGGRFILLEYRGSLDGDPLEGLFLIGCRLDTGEFEAAWVDSFHNGSTIMDCAGTRSGEGFSVLGHYRDPSGGPDWGWRTEFHQPDAGHLVITAYNITPNGEEARAVETVYTRRDQDASESRV